MKNNETNWDCRLKSFLSDEMSSKPLDIKAYGCYVRNRYVSETNTDTSNCADACSGK